MKPALDLSPEQIAGVERWAQQHGCRLVVVFGSRARGEARADSDYDVAVWAPMPEQPRDLLRWVNELEDVLGAPTQLVMMRDVEPVLGWEIGRDGRPLVETEDGLWTRERLRLWHLYNDSLPFRRLRRQRLSEFAAEVRRGA